jgi:hypothetical protein
MMDAATEKIMKRDLNFKLEIFLMEETEKMNKEY